MTGQRPTLPIKKPASVVIHGPAGVKVSFDRSTFLDSHRELCLVRKTKAHENCTKKPAASVLTMAVSVGRELCTSAVGVSSDEHGDCCESFVTEKSMVLPAFNGWSGFQNERGSDSGAKHA
jgi:hypothetical protein